MGKRRFVHIQPPKRPLVSGVRGEAVAKLPMEVSVGVGARARRVRVPAAGGCGEEAAALGAVHARELSRGALTLLTELDRFPAVRHQLAAISPFLGEGEAPEARLEGRCCQHTPIDGHYWDGVRCPESLW